MCIAAGFHSYANSPFGKPNRTVHFSAVQCVGSESRITDCPTTNYTYEQGKLLAGHLAVAGVTCKQYCPISTPPPVELTTTQYVTSECPAATTLCPLSPMELTTTQYVTSECPAATTLCPLSPMELTTTQYVTSECPAATTLCPLSPMELTTTQYVTSECPAATTLCPLSPVELTTTQYVTSECPATALCFLSPVELTVTMSQSPATTTLCPSATTEYQVKTVTACPDLSPTQQARPDSVIDSQQTMTTILLTGLVAIFGTVSVTLAAW